jgi:protein SMG7
MILICQCDKFSRLLSQLAILASYSGDELVAVYRYFRSLAVNSPFPTARDNLIVAFEKV